MQPPRPKHLSPLRVSSSFSENRAERAESKRKARGPRTSDPGGSPLWILAYVMTLPTNIYVQGSRKSKLFLPSFCRKTTFCEHPISKFQHRPPQTNTHSNKHQSTANKQRSKQQQTAHSKQRTTTAVALVGLVTQLVHLLGLARYRTNENQTLDATHSSCFFKQGLAQHTFYLFVLSFSCCCCTLYATRGAPCHPRRGLKQSVPSSSPSSFSHDEVSWSVAAAAAAADMPSFELLPAPPSQ